MAEPSPYSQYEAALAALESLPGQMSGDLRSAELVQSNARSMAEAAFQNDIQRLAALRATAASRYQTARALLLERDVRIAEQVRGTPDVAGDDAALKTALDAQIAAASAVDAAVRAAASAGDGATAETARRAAGARQASEALRARQDRLHRDRLEADARAADEASARRRRRTLVAALSGGIIILIVAIVITLSTITL